MKISEAETLYVRPSLAQLALILVSILAGTGDPRCTVILAVSVLASCHSPHAEDRQVSLPPAPENLDP